MQNPAVSLKPATQKDELALSRLLYDYQRELLPYSGHSEADVRVYKYLPNYFVDPDRAAFFIMVDDKVGGFVLVNTHTLIETHAHSIAEFYVVPAFRHGGLGKQAAALAFSRFPGKWEVAQMAANHPAVRFWRQVINNVTNGKYKETLLDTDNWHGPVQTFDVV